jgi:hypothetical protein
VGGGHACRSDGYSTAVEGGDCDDVAVTATVLVTAVYAVVKAVVVCVCVETHAITVLQVTCTAVTVTITAHFLIVVGLSHSFF